MGAKMPMGMKAAAATMPVHVLFPVASVTSAPTATVCIHDPTFDTRAADQISAKFFRRSGSSDDSATHRGYGSANFYVLCASSLPGAVKTRKERDNYVREPALTTPLRLRATRRSWRLVAPRAAPSMSTTPCSTSLARC